MSFVNANLPIARFVPNWANADRSYPLLEAILRSSERNSKITAKDIADEPGKLRDFKLTYYPIDCDVEGDCGVGNCVAGTKSEPKQRLYSLSQCTASKRSQLAMSDIRYVDGAYSFSDHAKAQIAAKMQAMRKLLATQVGGLLYANAGLFNDGNATRRVQFANTTTGAANMQAQFEIDRTFMDTGFNEPFTVGGTELYDYIQAANIGGVNALGQRIDQANTQRKYYDALLNQIVGDGGEHLLAWDPQVFKFISWAKNAGMFATDYNSVDDLDALFKRGGGAGGSVIKGSLYDPKLGLVWDFNANFDPCTETWNWHYELHWDIFFMPDINCNNVGVNGIFHFTTCAPVMPPCPSGTAYPSPVAAHTFTGSTAALTFPLRVGTLSVGGYVTNPNTEVANKAAFVALINDNSNIVFTNASGNNVTYSGYSGITVDVNGVTDIVFS